MANRAKKFQKYLSRIPLDIRALGTARVYNQKVTPDIMAAVADVVNRIAGDGKEFSVKSVRNSDEFKRQAESIFTKPNPDNLKFLSEYDKFIRHSLQALSYSQILRQASQRPAATYRVVDWPLLKDIASGKDAAVEFLAAHAERIFRQSGLGMKLDRFFKKPDDQSLTRLRDAYVSLVNEHTGVRRIKEPRRIFPKMLNVMAFTRNVPGVIRGRPKPVTLEDISYNRENWRDTPKFHSPPRAQILPLNGKEGESSSISGVKREVKEFHRRQPEIGGALSESGGIEAHHIFPRGAHPEAATKRENIILLSSSQHREFAHPSDKESISKGYQLLCLLKKLDAVVESECKENCGFYRFSNFVEMLVQCGKLNAKEKRVLFQKPFPENNPEEKAGLVRRAADDLRRFLIKRYVEEN